MPRPGPVVFPRDKFELAGMGVVRMDLFCKINHIEPPAVFVVEKQHWYFGGVCAFYRPDTDAVRDLSVGERKMRDRGYGPGINICLEHCGTPCSHEVSRNWTWPGSDTDREPYGVILHEFGHHCDWLTGTKRWEYGSEYGEEVMNESRERPLTSYAATNPAEWFAEAFRLFMTNHGLLRALRPKTYNILCQNFTPVETSDWRRALGENVPQRIITNLIKKGAPC